MSQDGDQGFPGNFEVSVTYTLTDENAVEIHYEGSCDQDTVVNMTNHSYFNLAGHDAGSIENQTLVLKSGAVQPGDRFCIHPDRRACTGTGNPDGFHQRESNRSRDRSRFRTAQTDRRLRPQLYPDKAVEGSIELMAVASCKESGITMEAFTDLPCVQFYAGNFIAPVTGKNGVFYDKRNGFCLESQYVPNAINQEGEGETDPRGRRYLRHHNRIQIHFLRSYFIAIPENNAKIQHRRA